MEEEFLRSFDVHPTIFSRKSEICALGSFSGRKESLELKKPHVKFQTPLIVHHFNQDERSAEVRLFAGLY